MDQKEAATRLLDAYYNINTDSLPTKRIKSDWKPDNKRGFFLGIIRYSPIEEHIRELCTLLLSSDKFTEQQTFSSSVQLADLNHPPTYIDRMYALYLSTFHKHYKDVSSRNSSVQSFLDITNGSSNDITNILQSEMIHEKVLTQLDFKTAVAIRDRVCLFCWDNQECQAAHIIAQNNELSFGYDKRTIFEHAGLKQEHQVQNGLLLCSSCHGSFDKLKLFVEFENDKFLVKFVKDLHIQESEDRLKWPRTKILAIRTAGESLFNDGRRAVHSDGEMELYFVSNDKTLQPNREALKFHKAACLIWQMAGGAEPIDDDDSDDDDIDIPMCRSTMNWNSSIEKWIDCCLSPLSNEETQ